ncbi:MAG: lysylphosphatidylglycerol synthase domain-containing protein [Candidatus Nanopelagicales bacterium]
MQAGEVARVVVGNRISGTRPAAMVAAMAIERATDLAVALGGLALALILAPDVPLSLTATGVAALLATALAVGFVFAARWRPEWILSFSRVVELWLPDFAARLIAHQTRELCEGLRVMRGVRRTAVFMAVTLAIWASVSATILLGLAAADAQAPLMAIVLVNALLTLAMVLPLGARLHRHLPDRLRAGVGLLRHRCRCQCRGLVGVPSVLDRGGRPDVAGHGIGHSGPAGARLAFRQTGPISARRHEPCEGISRSGAADSFTGFERGSGATAARR